MSMPTVSLCRYRYSALDLLTGLEPIGQSMRQRFYCRAHLVTELQGPASQSVLQHGTQLLALQSRNGDGVKGQLLNADQQRSVLQLTDSDGAVQQVYSPYGHRRVDGGPGSALGFNGEAVDSITGHYPLGNGRRMFNPVLMRFNSPDRLSPFGRGGLNPYAYCVGDPVNYSDPTGRWAEMGRLITSILGVSNTRLGMSRAIPAYNLAKDALRLGALRKLPARQSFAAFSTVTASGAILTTGLVGVGSAVAAIFEDPDAAEILGYVALGLTTLAVASRVGTYWAVKKPGTEAALMSFVKNKGQVAPPTPPASSRPSFASSSTFEPSAPPLQDISNSPVAGFKRNYDVMSGLNHDRPISKPRRTSVALNDAKKIRLDS